VAPINGSFRFGIHQNERSLILIIRYEYVTGEAVELEVDASVGKIVIGIEKEQENRNRAETRRHLSIEGLEEEIFLQFEDKEKNVESEVFTKLSLQALGEALQHLNPDQRELVKRVYFNGQAMAQIAKEEGVSKMAITNRMKKIHRKLKKILDQGVY